jgi:NADH-quinone oxidoreductase subunit E
MKKLLLKKEIDAFRKKAQKLEHPREMVIDLLRAIQDHFGWVPDAGVELAADILGVPPIEVEEVATFYDKIYRQEVGRYPIHICDSICCWTRGGEEIAAHLQQHLGIKLGQTTTDGLFTLLPTCCLGGCGRAPSIMVGKRFYGHLTCDGLDQIIAKLREEAVG